MWVPSVVVMQELLLLKQSKRERKLCPPFFISFYYCYCHDRQQQYTFQIISGRRGSFMWWHWDKEQEADMMTHAMIHVTPNITQLSWWLENYDGRDTAKMIMGHWANYLRSKLICDHVDHNLWSSWSHFQIKLMTLYDKVTWLCHVMIAHSGVTIFCWCTQWSKIINCDWWVLFRAQPPTPVTTLGLGKNMFCNFGILN